MNEEEQFTALSNWQINLLLNKFELLEQVATCVHMTTEEFSHFINKNYFLTHNQYNCINEIIQNYRNSDNLPSTAAFE